MDGTLVQTRAASWDVFQDTARNFRLPITNAGEFFELFAGNFYESLASLCGDPVLEAEVRQHFLQGLRDRYAPEFVPGMRDVVKELASRYPLAVMSSNAMGAIRRILEREGLAQCFAHVFSGDAGATKEAQLRQILDEPSYGNARHCSPSYVEGGEQREAAEVVLVTDTVGDVREAQRSGARAIGVAWGMHSADALSAAGAESVAMWPQELLTTLPPVDAASATDSAGNSCRCAAAGTCRAQPAVTPYTSSAEARRTSATPAAERPESSSSWAAAAKAGELRRRRRSNPATRTPHPIVPQTTPALTAPTSLSRADPILAAALHRIAFPSDGPCRGSGTRTAR
jgi:phosphoglycolate phosphatase